MNDNSWINKYKPNNIHEVIGNKKQIDYIKSWLEDFQNQKITMKNFKNSILISGHPGIGKTLVSHLLLKDYGYDIVELNSSCARTSKELNDKILSIFEAKSIKTMFNKKAKTGIILDEIDGIDTKKEYTSNDITNFFNYETNKFYTNIKKKISKKDKKYLINKNPIICTCNNLDKTLRSLTEQVIHIKFDKPNDEDIYKLLKKITLNENLKINEVTLRLIIPYCQYDFRRTIYLIELLAGYIKNSDNNNINQILNFIKNLGNKDLDIGLYDGIDMIFNNYNLGHEDLINIYHTDINFIPYITHENFINFMDKNTNESYIDKLDKCLKYYDNLVNSLLIKNNSFGKWELIDYVGWLNTVSPNLILKESQIKNTLVDSYITKSALISKYNYRYYNLKFINQISKKINVNMYNFRTLSIFIAASIFLNNDNFEYTISKVKKMGLDSKDYQKIIKLSVIFEQYSRLFTKKIQCI